MKKLFALFLLFSLKAVAQNSVLHMKDGTIYNGETWFEPDRKEKTVSFYATNIGSKKKWKTIKVEDLDYAEVAGYAKFKSFGKRGHFVLAEGNGKWLVSQAMVETIGHNEFYHYKLQVLDETYELMDEIIFTRFPSKDKSVTRGLVPDFVRKYFSDCDQLIERLNTMNSTDDKNLEICKLLDQPIYINCTK